MFFQLSLCFLISVSDTLLSRGYKMFVDYIGGCEKLNLHSAFDFLWQVWECLWICLLTRSPSSGSLFGILQVIISSKNDVNSLSPSHPYTGASSSQISIWIWGEILYSVKTSLKFFLKEQHCSLKSTLKTDGIENQKNSELMYSNHLFNWTLIVPLSYGNCDNILTLLLTSAETFTTCPFILNWFPLGACRGFWKAYLKHL